MTQFFCMNINNLHAAAPSVTMSSMSLKKQGGYVSSTLISLIISIVLLVGALSFGVWAFMSRQDYKNNSDKKAADAAATSKEATEQADAVKYAEEAKRPLKSHKALDQFGSVVVLYPKTWSGYIDESGNGTEPVDDYFHPDVVPGLSQKNAAYALRVQVVQRTYDQVMNSYKGDVNNNKLSASPATLTKVPGVVGTRLEGQVDQNKTGVMIVLPVRNLTLKIWTESKDFVPDFEKLILPNISFSP